MHISLLYFLSSFLLLLYQHHTFKQVLLSECKWTMGNYGVDNIEVYILYVIVSAHYIHDAEIYPVMTLDLLP